MQDLRLAARNLRKAPLFTAVAVLLVALGTGLNTALFSLLYAAVLKPLPYRDDERLVTIREVEPARSGWPLTPANFDDLRREATSFEDTTAYEAFHYELELSDVATPQRISALYVFEGFFSFAGVSPLIGRTLAEGDFGTASEEETRETWIILGDVAVLDHGFWMRQFGGSPEIVGKTLRLDDKSFRIVGVMPEGFDALWRETDLYLPSMRGRRFWRRGGGGHLLSVLARLRPGVSVETASSEVATIYARLAQEYPETNEVLTASVEPLGSSRFGDSARALVILLVGALMVLAVACSNLAGLLATRARARIKEVAVRRALGASARRVAGQLLTESLLLAGAGGILGIAAAYTSLRMLSLPMSLPFEPELSLPVLVYCLILLGATAVFLGLTPAWLVSRIDLTPALRGLTEEASSPRMVGTSIVVQVALAFALVSASGLLLRSLASLSGEELGFEKERLLSFRVVLPNTRYPDRRDDTQFRRRALEELRSVPGVHSVAAASHLPMTPLPGGLATAIEGRPAPRGTFRAGAVFVSHGLLRTLGVRLSRGRDFDARDGKESPKVVIVNERMARDFWPGEAALGKRIRLQWFQDPWTVVGVVPDVKQHRLDQEVRPAFYVLYEQFSNVNWLYFALRTEGAPQDFVSVARARIASIDPHLPVTDVQTLDERVAGSLSEHRARATLVGLYASAALLLAILGLYGTLESVVGQRTRELVIRMALGATRPHIVQLVMTRGLTLLALGVAIGLGLTVIGRRFVSSLLYGVEPTAGASLFVTTAILLASGALAAFVPANRASRLELATRLRQE